MPAESLQKQCRLLYTEFKAQQKIARPRTNREAANLERGQAKVDRREAKAAANGHVGAGEQRRIQAAENHQSKRIHREKHNDRERN
jgi:hypothetical protein